MDRVVEEISQILRQKKWTLAIAESCTGGMIASRVTDLPGVSDFFMGGIVAYANSLKTQILQVPEATIKNEGAVSESVVLLMARGAKRVFHCDCAISVSGVAGPSGGTSRTPVGTVWMAVVGPGFEKAEVHHFSGNRAEVRLQSTTKALELLLNQVSNTSSQKN